MRVALYLLSSFLTIGVDAFQLTPHPLLVRHTFLFSKQQGRYNDKGGFHTYDEGMIYDDREAEIEAMGGDPFFLDDDEEDDAIDNDSKDGPSDSLLAAAGISSSILSKASKISGDISQVDSEDNDEATSDGSDDKWVWDGEVDEDVYFDG